MVSKNRRIRKKGYKKPKAFQSNKTDLKMLSHNLDKVISEVRLLKKEPEVKVYDYVDKTGVYIPGTPMVIRYTRPIVLGTHDYERIGSSIFLRGVKLNLLVDNTSSTGTDITRVRVVLLQATQDLLQNTLFPADVWGTATPTVMELYRHDVIKDKVFKILYDKTILSEPIDDMNRYGKHHIKRYIRIGKKVTYYGDTNADTSIGKNHIFLITWAESADYVTLFQYSRMYYNDN